MGSFSYSMVWMTVGVVNPGWKAFKAHKTGNTTAKDAYLIYFIVLSFYTALEFVADYSISFLPFYWELKTVLVLYLAQYDGAKTVYNSWLYPVLNQNEDHIERAVQDGKEKAAQKAKEYGVVAAAFVKKHGQDLIVKGKQAIVQQLANGQGLNVQRRTAARASAPAPSSGSGPAEGHDGSD